jgi:ABC-type transport system substrate-binding protein
VSFARTLCGLAFAAAFFGTSVAGAADMTKTLRVAFRVAENGFDPQAAYDSYSFYVIGGIFDPLYVYDYFARPVRMVPNTAAAMPEITDQGRTYTIKVAPGIYFASDPAFKGKRRELTAEDYVYSFKRIFDPKVRSYWLYLFEGNLEGLDEPLAAARKSGTWDYDAPLEGLRTLDRFTLQIRFRRPNHGFEWWLTTSQFSAVAREVVEAYKDASNRVMENPVGTGAYRLKQWTRGQRIVLEANPDYRDVVYPAPGAGSAGPDAAIARGLTGRKLPLVGTVDISIIEEAHPRLLAFDAGQLDYLAVPASLSPNVIDGAALKPEYVKRGVMLHRHVTPSVSFFYFNLDHPVVGGYGPEKIALRRAISMGYDRAGAISALAHGQAIPASQPVPPALYGHDPKYVPPYGYDPRGARALLDKFGYKDRDGDGYRELPDGKPLTIQLASTTDNAARASDELWKRCMDAIGIRITFLKNKWPELNKMSEAGQLMMWGLSWISSVPDGNDYYSYFDSRNIGTSNDARMRLPAFDALYKRSRDLPHGAERTKLYGEMTDLIYAYAPWILSTYAYENVLTQPTAQGLQAASVRRASVALLRRGPTPALTAAQGSLRHVSGGTTPVEVRRLLALRIAAPAMIVPCCSADAAAGVRHARPTSSQRPLRSERNSASITRMFAIASSTP